MASSSRRSALLPARNLRLRMLMLMIHSLPNPRGGWHAQRYSEGRGEAPQKSPLAADPTGEYPGLHALCHGPFLFSFQPFEACFRLAGKADVRRSSGEILKHLPRLGTGDLFENPNSPQVAPCLGGAYQARFG
jgi:hypothetical protein